MPDNQPAPEIQVHPVTADRWADLEALFGPRGAMAGCWCMWWRLPRPAFDAGKGEGNRAALKEIVERGEVPGLLAYVDGRPVGWCAVGPRHWYAGLERSRKLKRVDDKPVWSITCFFIHRRERRKGIMRALLHAAIDHARAHGARLLEGYPLDTSRPDYPSAFAYTGFLPVFEREGFIEVVRRSTVQPMVRRTLALPDRPNAECEMRSAE